MLGDIAGRLKAKLKSGPAKEQFIGNDAANAMLKAQRCITGGSCKPPRTPRGKEMARATASPKSAGQRSDYLRMAQQSLAERARRIGLLLRVGGDDRIGADARVDAGIFQALLEGALDDAILAAVKADDRGDTPAAEHWG